MGLFDYVVVSGPEFVCSEGHSLMDSEFQSKDFGCTMGQFSLSRAEGLTGNDGGYGDPPQRPLLGRFIVYGQCRKCPALVQAGTHNLCDVWVDFEVEFRDDKVCSIRRVSPDTKTWIEQELSQEWMKGAHGPMSWEQANDLHCSWGKPCECGANAPRKS